MYTVMVATDAHVNIETDVCTQRTLNNTNVVYRQTQHLNAIQQCTCCQCAYVVETVAIKVPDDGSDELKLVPHCCVALKCCV